MPSIPTATDVAPVVPSSRLRTTRRSVNLYGCGFPGAVQAAARVALEVERVELVAGGAQRVYNLLAIRNEARDLRGLDLDACDVAVMAHPHLSESEGFY